MSRICRSVHARPVGQTVSLPRATDLGSRPKGRLTVCPTRARERRNVAGFTLIEILVALVLLGMTAVVLLDAHYGSMRLFTDMRDEVLMQGFLERALGQAEVDVMTGTLTGTGTFGKRYPDYSYSYTAQLLGESDSVPLYTVTASVTGPEDETQSMTVLVYSTNQ